jgi:myo-inositol-1(or 4)-monophosphatase
MKPAQLNQALLHAVEAARRAGDLMLGNRSVKKKINLQSQHDIKLELDVRCQRIIQKALLEGLPGSSLLGEEGRAGPEDSPLRWVVDPIDGTVNFAYGVPHACVSIALQERPEPGGDYSTILGVVLDPFCSELWTGLRGGPAKLNGKKIRVSRRTRLEEAIIAIGFAKQTQSLRENLPLFNALIWRARKMRIMGAAALSLAYVASGRFDAYIESGIQLWDIAAAGFILERAGGDFFRQKIAGQQTYRMLANNGLLRRKIQRVIQAA